MIETAISLSTRGHFRILKSGHFNFLLTPPGAQCLQNQPQGRIHAKTEKNIDDDDLNRVIMTNTHIITRLGVAALLRSGWQPSRETGGRIQ